MSLFSPSTGNPLGLHPGRQEKVRVKMRNSAGVVGQIVYFDLAASDGEVTASTAFGAATNPTSNVILATAAVNGSATTVQYFYAVLTEAVAENGEAWAVIRGVVKALAGATVATAGGVGGSTTDNGEFVTLAAGAQCPLVTLQATTENSLAWVAFDGIYGFASPKTLA